MGALRTFSRRSFLIASTAIAGGVAFGTYAYRKDNTNPLLGDLAADEAAITPYVKITQDGVTLITPRADKGQGAYSVQAHLIAEELDVNPHNINVDPGMPAPAYYNGAVLAEGAPFPAHDTGWLAERVRSFMDVPAKLLGMQMTGGSSTVPDQFEKLRLAGATARETLKEAAAQQFNVERTTLSTDDSHVVLPDGKRIPYTELASKAASIEPIKNVRLRSPDTWRYIGKSDVHRIDMTRKCTGTEQYGIDLSFPDMVFASVRANPALGGGVRKYNAQKALSMRGVLDVVEINGGVSVIADNTWRAIKAVNAIDIEFDAGPQPTSQDAIWNTLDEAFDDKRDSRNKNDGDVDAALNNAGSDSILVEAEYRVPYLAHAPLEPMNAVVRYTKELCEIWTGTQIPGFIQEHAAKLTGLDKHKVRVYVQPMGGSFGRRLEDTYVLQAIEIAMKREGVPVKMTWSREEDMTHDYPRPASIARARGLIAHNSINAIDFDVASQSVMASWMARLMGPVAGPDVTIVSGAWDQPFKVPNYRVTGYRAPEMIPVSSWRSVGNSGVGFMHGSFFDELCAAANIDPLDAMIALCSHDLSRAVLEDVKRLSAWNGRRISDNQARGVAFTLSFGVPTAEVVEVSQSADGIKIDKVYVSCEVGTVLDPINLKAQLMGGALFGLGHAMNCELTYEQQKPQQTNYHAYEAMRLYQAPEVVVNALENGNTVRGIGEPAVPPAAAALANAIFALNGQRVRELPLNREVDFV